MTDTRTDRDWLAQRFETHRTHLRAVAYRMLGSLTEADDVVQDAWLRLARADTSEVDNLGGWLTTVVARLSLDALRARKAKREEPTGLQLPEPVVEVGDGSGGPEEQAVMAESVGLAMLVVLDTLSPAERMAFVLHDVFGLPFEEIAPIVRRTPMATRKLASRARQRVRGSRTVSDADLPAQRRVVDAFLATARDGDFERLLAILDPDVVVRADFGAGRAQTAVVRGAHAVAEQALLFRRLADGARPATVNGGAGFVVYAGERLYAVIAFTVRRGRVVEFDVFADPDRLERLKLSAA